MLSVKCAVIAPPENIMVSLLVKAAKVSLSVVFAATLIILAVGSKIVRLTCITEINANTVD